jgi:hypothetical protein
MLQSTAKASEYFDRKIAFVTKRLEELQKVARSKSGERACKIFARWTFAVRYRQQYGCSNKDSLVGCLVHHVVAMQRWSKASNS